MTSYIDQLVLSVPGLSPRDATELARRVIAKIRRGLPDTFQIVSLSHLNVKLSLPLGLRLEELADRIARAVIEQVRPGGKP